MTLNDEYVIMWLVWFWYLIQRAFGRDNLHFCVIFVERQAFVDLFLHI